MAEQFCFESGDGVSLCSAPPHRWLFDKQSSWSKAHELVGKYAGIVLFASTKRTGSGRLWHKVMLVDDKGAVHIGWLESPWGLVKL